MAEHRNPPMSAEELRRRVEDIALIASERCRATETGVAEDCSCGRDWS